MSPSPTPLASGSSMISSAAHSLPPSALPPRIQASAIAPKPRFVKLCFWEQVAEARFCCERGCNCSGRARHAELAVALPRRRRGSCFRVRLPRGWLCVVCGAGLIYHSKPLCFSLLTTPPDTRIQAPKAGQPAAPACAPCASRCRPERWGG